MKLYVLSNIDSSIVFASKNMARLIRFKKMQNSPQDYVVLLLEKKAGSIEVSLISPASFDYIQTGIDLKAFNLFNRVVRGYDPLSEEFKLSLQSPKEVLSATA